MYITLRVLIREVAPPNILPAEARDDVFIDSDINSLDYEISNSFDLLRSASFNVMLLSTNLSENNYGILFCNNNARIITRGKNFTARESLPKVALLDLCGLLCVFI